MCTGIGLAESALAARVLELEQLTGKSALSAATAKLLDLYERRCIEGSPPRSTSPEQLQSTHRRLRPQPLHPDTLLEGDTGTANNYNFSAHSHFTDRQLGD